MSPLDQLVLPLWEAVRQQGFSFIIMAGVVIYFYRELRDERRAHDETTGKLLTFATQFATTSVETSEALRALKGIIERLADDRRDQRLIEDHRSRSGHHDR